MVVGVVSLERCDGGRCSLLLNTSHEECIDILRR